MEPAGCTSGAFGALHLHRGLPANARTRASVVPGSTDGKHTVKGGAEKEEPVATQQVVPSEKSKGHSVTHTAELSSAKKTSTSSTPWPDAVAAVWFNSELDAPLLIRRGAGGAGSTHERVGVDVAASAAYWYLNTGLCGGGRICVLCIYCCAPRKPAARTLQALSAACTASTTSAGMPQVTSKACM